MKILHLITGLGNGGAEASLVRLVTNDKKNSHVVISMMNEGKYGEYLKISNIETYTLNSQKGYIMPYSLIKLWKIIKNTNPDLIQTWMYHADLVGGLLSKFQGIPCIWNIRHSNLSSTKTSLSTRLVVKSCSLFSHFIPRKIISCSKNSIKIHQSISYAKDKFIAIPNGYNLEKIKPLNEQIVTKNTETNKKILIGMVGRFDPQKDHLNLIKSLAIVKSKNIDFHCFLVGKDLSLDNQELSTWINEASINGNISLLGQQDDITGFMNTLDIHVLSSSYGEAFPNVVAEAMACGIPNIATNVGDAAYIVGDTGWIVPPSDSEALADAIIVAIEEIHTNIDAWQARKQAARQRIIDNFDIDRMVAAYNEVWQEVKK